MSEWRDSASCAQSDPDVFFPEEGKDGYEQTRAALAICEACPVVTECWWDQITSGEEPWGIRGGQKPAELKASMKAFEQGGDQRPEIESKARAEEERAEKLAATRLRQREYSSRRWEGIKERAAAGDQEAIRQVEARRSRVNRADQARRAREREQRMEEAREETIGHLYYEQETQRDEPVAEVA